MKSDFKESFYDSGQMEFNSSRSRTNINTRKHELEEVNMSNRSSNNLQKKIKNKIAAQNGQPEYQRRMTLDDYLADKIKDKFSEYERLGDVGEVYEQDFRKYKKCKFFFVKLAS